MIDMRYYNENPQVTLWREKYNKLREEYLDLLDEYETSSDSVSFNKYQVEAIEARTKEAFHSFNSLPWYKKMFYKFKI